MGPSRRFLAALLLLPLLGCSHIGPGTLARDRLDYTTAVGDSWKRQMLLNVVKLRYGDAPVFVEVSSIINQYSLESGISASLGWSAPPSSNSQSAGGSASFYDRPTISYNLLTGEKFTRSLLTPIPPPTVLSLLESGYPIDLVFRFIVSSVNGIRNQFGGYGRARAADPEFFVLLDRLQSIQGSGAVSMRVRRVGDRDALLMVFREQGHGEVDAASREVRRMLGLREGAREFRVVYGATSTGPDEIALLTRSIYEVLVDTAASVEVPPQDVAEKRVSPPLESEGGTLQPPLVGIHSSKERPADAFVAVPYRDRWFWIDARDYQSKRLFSFLMFAMALTETGGQGGAPLVTISAGG